MAVRGTGPGGRRAGHVARARGPSVAPDGVGASQVLLGPQQIRTRAVVARIDAQRLLPKAHGVSEPTRREGLEAPRPVLVLEVLGHSRVSGILAPHDLEVAHRLGGAPLLQSRDSTLVE